MNNRFIAVWVWQKNIRSKDEIEWSSRLASLPGVVFSSLPGRQCIDVRCYSDEPTTLLVLYSAYGGNFSSVEEKDWVAATAPTQIAPLLIRDKLVIYSAEEQLPALQRCYPKRILLHFPAECAFGTGHHATTSTCLRLLCDEARGRVGTPWRLIDAGCGTGILALAALRLGARSAVAFDFDPKAVEIARRNIKRNGSSPALRLLQADVFQWEAAPQEKAHVIVANLFSAILQRAFPRLVQSFVQNHPCALIASGILRDQTDDTIRSARLAGLQLTKKITRGKWVTLQFAYNV